MNMQWRGIPFRDSTFIILHSSFIIPALSLLLSVPSVPLW
jgi:hypothetical protein